MIIRIEILVLHATEKKFLRCKLWNPFVVKKHMMHKNWVFGV